MAETSNGHAWFTRFIPVAGILITLAVYGITLVTWTTRLDVRVSNLETEEIDLDRLTKRMDTEGTQQMRLIEQRLRIAEQHNAEQDKRAEFLDTMVRSINERLSVSDERQRNMITKLDVGSQKLDNILDTLKQRNNGR